MARRVEVIGRSFHANPLLQRWATFLLIGSVVVVLVATLYPYQLQFQSPTGEWESQELLERLTKPNTRYDYIKNTFLFLPLGFALGAWSQMRAIARKKAFLMVVAIAAGMSLFGESVQVFMPARFPQLLDPPVNLAGAVLGYGIFRLVGFPVLVFIDLLGMGFVNLPSWVWFFGFLGYLALHLSLVIPLQSDLSLVNWDPDYPLQIGRSWRGKIKSIYIADRSLEPGEIGHLSGVDGMPIAIQESLVASYHLVGPAPYADRMAITPDLVWHGGGSSGAPAVMETDEWLRSDGPAREIVEKLRETSQFTLILGAATADPEQQSRSGLVALADGSRGFNFTLGQAGDGAIFRLNTPLLERRPSNIELYVPRVFQDKDFNKLVVTYDGAELLFYLDGVPVPQSLALSPGTSFFSWWSDPNIHNLIGYKVLYYVVVFIPLGLAIGIAAAIWQLKGGVLGWVKVGLGLLLPPLALEMGYTLAAGRAFRYENVVLSVSIFLAAAIFFGWQAAKIKGAFKIDYAHHDRRTIVRGAFREIRFC